MFKVIQFHPWAGTASTSPGCSQSRPTWPWALPGRGKPQLLWATWARVSPPSWGKNFFLIANRNLPSFSSEPLPLVLSLHPLVKSPSPSFLSAPSGTDSCSKVTSEPSLLQAELPQLPQPVLVGEVLQPLDHLRGPPLDPLQHIHVLLVLGAPELDAGLQVGSALPQIYSPHLWVKCRSPFDRESRTALSETLPSQHSCRFGIGLVGCSQGDPSLPEIQGSPAFATV